MLLGLPALRSLSLVDSGISQESLAHVGRCTKLTRLELQVRCSCKCCWCLFLFCWLCWAYPVVCACVVKCHRMGVLLVCCMHVSAD